VCVCAQITSRPPPPPPPPPKNTHPTPPPPPPYTHTTNSSGTPRNADTQSAGPADTALRRTATEDKGEPESYTISFSFGIYVYSVHIWLVNPRV